VSHLVQEFVKSQCPYCGEIVELGVDCSIPQQEYIEDCHVCCRPIQVIASVDEQGIPSIYLSDENN